MTTTNKIGYLSSASIILTDRCNMACKYCYEKNNSTMCDDMTTQMGKNIVDFLITQANRGLEKNISITFFGGEPTLNVPVMQDILDYALLRTKQENLSLGVDLITNGTTPLTGRYLDFINKWCASGVSVRIQLSIDGCPEVHDSNRIMTNGQGSIDIIESNIDAYRELFGAQFNSCLAIHSTLSLKSLPYLYDSYKYFVETLGLINITFMPLHEENWMNSKGDHAEYENQLMNIGEYIIANPKKYELANSFNVTSYCGDTLSEKPCGAGYSFCTIDSKGDIYPCHRFRCVDQSTKIGNISDDIQNIDANRSFYMEYTSDALISKYSCADCNNAGCFRCIAANYEYNQNQLLGFPKHCDMELVHKKVKNYVRDKLQLDQYDNDNNSPNADIMKEIGDLAIALKENIIPMKEFMDGINKKVDAVLEMNAVLIQLVKGLIERD